MKSVPFKPAPTVGVNYSDGGEDPRMAKCPVCDGDVPLEADIVVGELLECPDCGSELEILKVEPLALGEAPETEEDWGE